MAFSPVTTVPIEVTKESAWHRLREDLPHVMLSNMGPDIVYVAFGDEGSGLAAGMPIFPETQVLLNKGIGGPGITVAAPGNASLLLVTLGSGG